MVIHLKMEILLSEQDAARVAEALRAVLHRWDVLHHQLYSDANGKGKALLLLTKVAAEYPDHQVGLKALKAALKQCNYPLQQEVQITTTDTVRI